MKFFLMCILLLSTHWATAKAESQTGLADLISQYKQHYGFSGAVLVLKNGKPIFTKAQGYADDVKLQEVTLLTRFDIGSIQKDLTAILVLQAYDNGLLDLDDTLDKFSLAFADPKTNKITIKQLLEHRSGFADIFTAEYRKNPSKYTNIAEKMEILRQQPLLFEPGTERKYSNYGYIILGAVLEKVTKQDYWTLLEKNVLQPSRTSLATKQSGHDFVALPYHFNYAGKRQLVDLSMLEYKTPDGGGELTVYELYAVYQQLFNQKKLLSDSSLQIFRMLQKDQGQWLAFGGGAGVSTAVEIDFANDIWVIVLANTDRLVAEELSSRLRSLALSGQNTKVQLPATLFAYQKFQELGEKSFGMQFETVYKNAGYQTFLGKTITDLARELIADGKAEDSIYFFRYLTNKFPEHAAVYDGLAYGYFSAGRYDDAKAAFAKAKALNPDYDSQFNVGNYEAKYQ
jgi:CubicO group peptidase (beta-lactamase class C family)